MEEVDGWMTGHFDAEWFWMQDWLYFDNLQNATLGRNNLSKE